MMKKNSNTSSTTSSSKMANTQNIKVVRLQSGEDIIADVISDNDTTILNNPMVVMLRRSQTGSVMMMAPWLPVELISDNIATINNTEIVTETKPKDSLVEYYLTMVDRTETDALKSGEMLEKYNENLSDKKDYIDEYLDDNMGYEDAEYDEESAMEELLSNMSMPDKKQLH